MGKIDIDAEIKRLSQDIIDIDAEIKKLRTMTAEGRREYGEYINSLAAKKRIEKRDKKSNKND